MELLPFWLVFSFVVAWWASRWHRSSIGFFALALILSPILAGLILAVLGKPKKLEQAASPRRSQEELEHEERLAQIHAVSRTNVPISHQLEKLAQLRDRGVLTAEEFEAQKKRLMP